MSSLTLDACSLILEEIRKLDEKIDALMERAPPPRKRKERTPTQVCAGKTAKGDACNHRALSGSDFCKMHDPDRKKASPSAPTQRLQRIEPEHAHAPNEAPKDVCELCETQGDPLNENDEEEEYLMDDEANERLRALLRENDL